MTLPAEPGALLRLSDSLAALVAGATPHVVAVHSHRARSSGFVWKPGLIVTAEEALADEGEVSVSLPGGETVPARLVGRDPTTDIALLRVDRNDIPPAPQEDAAEPRAGSIAVVVGAEIGGPVASFGIVAGVGPAWRSLRGGEIDRRIELAAPLRRSAEGALALDAAGSVLGMAVFGPRRSVLVIPAKTIARAAARLETHGRVVRGYVGLGLQPVRIDDGTGYGAMVMSVVPGGPGATAGLRQGDVISAVDGEPLRGPQGLQRSLGPDSVGRTVVLSIKRGGEPLELKLTIAERPQD
jgi:S1-C subfamily serine protease